MSTFLVSKSVIKTLLTKAGLPLCDDAVLLFVQLSLCPSVT